MEACSLHSVTMVPLLGKDLGKDLTIPSQPKPDWAKFIRDSGQRIRKAREFLGLSQDQLARLADVSQGAVSRVEAGRGMATPLLTFVKLNRVMAQALRRLEPELLTDQARAMLETAEHMVPAMDENEQPLAPILRDPALDRLISMYRTLPERERRGFLSVLDATAASLSREGDLGVPARAEAQRGH